MLLSFSLYQFKHTKSDLRNVPFVPFLFDERTSSLFGDAHYFLKHSFTLLVGDEMDCHVAFRSIGSASTFLVVVFSLWR